MQTRDVGETASIITEWYDDNGAAADPTSIDLVVHPPTGVDVVLTKADMVQGDSVDEWIYAFVLTQSGLYRYSLDGVVNTREVVQPDGAILVGPQPTTGPCQPWCSWDDVQACGPESIDALSAADREAVIDFASEILWNLSGRVYSGICQTTRSLCHGCVTCYPNVCRCEPVNGFDLGIRSPVLAVWDVIVNGVLVDPAEYTIVARRWLARLDRHQWPYAWDMLVPDKFKASWAFGRSIPVGARRAAAIFAVEVAKSCPAACGQLPKGTTGISAEGVNYTIDPQYLNFGFTGLSLVDAWLEADRRGRRPKPSFFAPGASSPRAYR